MEKKDYYDILGVSKEASADEIKKAYRTLSMKWHPDRWANGTNEEKKVAEDKFKDIAEAYEVLSDPQKRSQYDNGGFEFQQGGFDPMDIFTKMQESFSDPFSWFGQRGPKQKKGQDIDVGVTITLQESYSGCRKTVQIPKNKLCAHCHGTGNADGLDHKCPHCNGTGMVTKMQQMGPGSFSMSSSPCPHCHGRGKDIVTPCHECNGTGFIPEYSNEEINIPRGICNGMTMVVSGKGNSIEGGVNGDLRVHVTVLDDIYFERPDELNLIHRERVPFNEVLLGFEKKFRCIDGSEVTVRVPELTKDGEAFIIRGKGMPDVNGRGLIGDYAVIINYELPKKLTNKQKDVLKHFND